MSENKPSENNQIVECKKCGTPCMGSFFDPANLERLCVNCAYEIWKKR
jgi:formylmethanofuran dehydrogenase subunit E